MPKQYNKRLIDLFTKYASSIGWMLFGHLHTDTFRVLKVFILCLLRAMVEIRNKDF